MTAAFPKGQTVVVAQLGESPLDAIADHMSLAEMPAPDPKTLGTSDVSSCRSRAHPLAGSIS